MVGVSSKGVELPGAVASVSVIWLRLSLGRLGGSLDLEVLGKEITLICQPVILYYLITCYY